MPSDRRAANPAPTKKVGLSFPLQVSGPEVSLNDIHLGRPVLLRSGDGAATLRLGGAKHFLDLLERHVSHQFLAVTYFDAFCSAARSVTFVLQAEGSSQPGFDDWYASWQAKMKGDKFARLLVDMRNESQKQAPTKLRIDHEWEVRHALDGSITPGVAQSTVTVAGKPVGDVIQFCKHVYGILREIVEDASRNGFDGIPTDARGSLGVAYLRETPRGDWVPFDPPNWQPDPTEFASRRDYDAWKRQVKPPHVVNAHAKPVAP